MKRIVRFSLFIVFLGLAACGELSFDPFELLAGHETNTVVLSKDPLLIDDQPVTFSTDGNAVIVGESGEVCVSLRGDFPHQSNDVMKAEFERLMGGATLFATISVKSGEPITISSPARSWAMHGTVVERHEIAACVTLNCSNFDLEVGTVIDKISVSSDKPLRVLGAYWESTNAWD